MDARTDTDLRMLLDRAEIDDLLTRYTYTVDAREFDRLDTVFTPDAHIDYTATGGIAGEFPEVQRWLADALALASHMQHVLGQREIELDGDAARVRAYFWNPMRFTPPEGDPLELHLGGVYEHDLIRTGAGWRSRRLVEHLLWRR